MKMHWAAVAAVATIAAMPAMAQNNMTPTSAMTTRQVKNVDEASVRSNLDMLRTRLDRIADNTRMMMASGDIVQADWYRRMNATDLDAATALTMNISSELGGPMTIPSGWGLARDGVADIGAALGAARMHGDYTAPIARARAALSGVYDALNQSKTGMSGGNMGSNMNM